MTLEDLGLKWSAPYEVPYEGSVLVVKSAKPTEKFWEEWRRRPGWFRKQGVYPRKYAGKYKVVQWLSSQSGKASFNIDAPQRL